jgi:hypothetical protein
MIAKPTEQVSNAGTRDGAASKLRKAYKAAPRGLVIAALSIGAWIVLILVFVVVAMFRGSS